MSSLQAFRLQGFYGDVRTLKKLLSEPCMAVPINTENNYSCATAKYYFAKTVFKHNSDFHMLMRKRGNNADGSVKCMQKQVLH